MRIVNFSKYLLMASTLIIPMAISGYLFFLGTLLATILGYVFVTVIIILQAHYLKIMDTREHIKETLNILTQYRGEAIEIKQSVDMIPDFIAGQQNKFVEYIHKVIDDTMKSLHR